jgi:hypothetical protein
MKNLMPMYRLAIISTLMSLLACSKISNSQPSNEILKEAIKKEGAYHPITGRKPAENVEIQLIGNYNVEQKYWPVKAKVLMTGRSLIDREYHVFKDDYGKWTAKEMD